MPHKNTFVVNSNDFAGDRSSVHIIDWHKFIQESLKNWFVIIIFLRDNQMSSWCWWWAANRRPGSKLKGAYTTLLPLSLAREFFQEVSKIFPQTATNIIIKNYVFQKYRQIRLLTTTLLLFLRETRNQSSRKTDSSSLLSAQNWDLRWAEDWETQAQYFCSASAFAARPQSKQTKKRIKSAKSLKESVKIFKFTEKIVAKALTFIDEKRNWKVFQC